MKKVLLFFIAVLMLLCMTACGEKDTSGLSATPSIASGEKDTPGPSATPSTASGEAKTSNMSSILIFADLSAGNPDGEADGLVQSKSIDMESPPDIEALADALYQWTGLDFSLADAHIDGNRAYVDWSADSTLVGGLGDRKQKEEFHFYDAVSLNWFMMDSLVRTIKENLPVDEVYFSMDGGNELVFPNPEDMAAQGLPVLPTNQTYEGSAFFVAHADGRGDEFEGDLPQFGDGMGDKFEEDDLPYWNGMDFGPNLEYYEEYIIEGDSGDYLNAAEGAKMTFETMRENGNIPGEYSDNIQYKMVLVSLEEIDGEECYVYRLDVDEPTGTVGAAYAYAYATGNIYMQGQGSQWVIVYSN